MGVMPSFFVLGSPKCGTSNFYEHLQGHPGIYAPQVKEPNYFCTDFPGYRKRTTLAHYQALYAGAPQGSICGDGSIWQLYSKEAVSNIEAEIDGPLYFVLLRDPTRAAFSLHKQMLRSLEEDIEDFEEAWSAQAERAQGLRIPAECREPSFLQYRDVYDYPPQLERLFKLVPRERVRIYIFEELIADPRSCYLDALAFLGLDDDGRDGFPPEQDNTRPSNRKLAAFLRDRVAPIWWEIADSPPARAYDRMAQRLGLPATGAIKDMIKGTGFRKMTRDQLAPETDAQLRAEFAPSVAATEALLGRELTAWR